MQNIDLIIIIQPIIFIAFSLGLVLYWHYKRSFTRDVLLYSLIAYFVAIALKLVFQSLISSQVLNMFGSSSPATGFYIGIQTAIFEVGLAFFVAVYAVKRNKLTAKDAEGYGLGLAFWENGVFLGMLTLISEVALYTLLASGTPEAQQVYSTLITNSPQYFYPPEQLLPSIWLGVLERVSSLLAHLSWGYLCVFAAYFHKKSYFFLALPMGFLIDFLVVFASALTIPLFEAIIFIISVIFVTLTFIATKDDRQRSKIQPPSS